MSDIPNIIVGGINMPVYSFDFSGGGQEKSEVTVRFVNRNGLYSRPELSSSTIVRIKVGSFFDFSGYCVSATLDNQTEGGNILTVKYTDTSSILDFYWVGLKGLHGPGFTTTSSGSFSNMILLGSQVDPCQNLTANKADPCAPACADEANNSAPPIFDCIKERSLKILEVSYTFNDLKNAAQSAGIRFDNFPNINNNYKASYTGRLRDVIKSWCEDYGLTFYWADSAVNFVDLKVGIEIRDGGIESSGRMISKSTSWSIEGNTTIGNVAYFGAEGETRSYSCSADTSKRLVLKPITLFDLFYDSAFSNGGASGKFLRSIYGNTQPMNYLQASCAMSYYSVDYRDLFFLYNVFGIIGPNEAQVWIDDPTNTPMTALGNLVPKIVLTTPDLSVSGPGEITKAVKDRAFASLINRMSASESKEFLDRKGYFIIADYNEALHNKITTMEKELSENFIGRYWIRKASDGNLYSYDAPDGSVNYYSYGSEIIFPFLQYLPDAVQNASDFLESIVDIDQSGNPETHSKFLLMDRSAMWVPSSNSRELELFLADVSKYQMEIVGSEDVVEGNLVGPEQVIVKMFPRPDDFLFQTENTDAVNVFDVKNVNLPAELGGFITSYGLYSAKSTIYRLKMPAASLRVFTPSQSYGDFGVQMAGYAVIANGNNIESNQDIILPKAEFVLGNVPPMDSKSMAMDINFRDATQNLVDFVNDSCGYSAAKIQSSLYNFNARTFTTSQIEQETRNYEFSGIPDTKFNLTDGLQSFQIRYGSNGVITSLSFSNIPKVPISENLQQREFEIKQSQLARAREYYRQK